MTVLDIASLMIGALGVAFAARCYLELWRWARQCQHARIAVAYKRRVKLQAPLLEWLMWCNQLDRDKDSHGRVVYSIGGTSIAITKAVIPPGKLRRLLTFRKRRPVRQGHYQARDETELARKQREARERLAKQRQGAA